MADRNSAKGRGTADEGRRCPVSGKRSYPTVHIAKTHARGLARHINEAGDFSVNMYVYECPDCHRIHLTRSPGSKELGFNTIVFQAPPRSLQRWAMTGNGTPKPAFGQAEQWEERPVQRRRKPKRTNL